MLSVWFCKQLREISNYRSEWQLIPTNRGRGYCRFHQEGCKSHIYKNLILWIWKINLNKIMQNNKTLREKDTKTWVWVECDCKPSKLQIVQLKISRTHQIIIHTLNSWSNIIPEPVYPLWTLFSHENFTNYPASLAKPTSSYTLKISFSDQIFWKTCPNYNKITTMSICIRLRCYNKLYQNTWFLKKFRV